jgi:hypothetical protein
MGVVYQARQTKLGRIVALKMILSGAHAGEADLARFRTEAEAIARLQHPNIVQIYEVGERDGRPYFSLEFCAGGSLEKKLGGRPLPPKEAARLVETLARAMQAAHDKGIIHRDLKPANVLLAEDGTPKITDFGLAKKLDEAGQTANGAVMGTPSYMAPEQAGGKSGLIGPACDVYALGAILYECLTGRPPFKAATVMDTLMQVIADDPVPVRRLQPRTPRDLETICHKCLEKQPGRRYPSAAMLAEDLRRFGAGEPVTARPVGALGRVVKWVRRSPRTAALLAVVLALGVTVVVGSLTTAARIAAEQKITKEAEEKALRSLGESNAQRDKANRSLYVAYMLLAQQAWKEKRVGRVEQLLDGVGAWDVRTGNAAWLQTRGWEWHYLRRLARAPASAEERRTLAGHEQPVTSLAWHPTDPGLLATASKDGTVRVWDVADGRTMYTYRPGLGVVGCVCWSPNGRMLACTGPAGGVKVFDVATEAEVANLPGHTFACWARTARG